MPPAFVCPTIKNINGFYIFKELEKIKGRFGDIQKLHGTQNSVFILKALLEHSLIYLFLRCLKLLLQYNREVDLLGQRFYDLQSQRYLLLTLSRSLLIPILENHLWQSGAWYLNQRPSPIEELYLGWLFQKSHQEGLFSQLIPLVCRIGPKG